MKVYKDAGYQRPVRNPGTAGLLPMWEEVCAICLCEKNNTTVMKHPNHILCFISCSPDRSKESRQIDRKLVKSSAVTSIGKWLCSMQQDQKGWSGSRRIDPSVLGVLYSFKPGASALESGR